MVSPSYTPQELNKIWDDIKNGVYEKAAKPVSDLTGAVVYHPRRVYSDATGDVMSVPHTSGGATVYQRKSETEEWTSLATLP